MGPHSLLAAVHHLQRAALTLSATGSLLPLSRNRPHVFSKHLEITGLEVAKVGANHEHVARVAEREVRLVLETNGEVQSPVLDRMGDKVHDLAVNLGVSTPKAIVFLLNSLVEIPPLLRRFGAQQELASRAPEK